MRLARVAWQGYAVPFARTYATSGARDTMRYGLLLFLQAEDGTTGLGEASPVGPGSRREVDALAAALAALPPHLLTMDPANPAAIRSLPTGLAPVLRFGLGTALLDLQGQARGCSVTALLGGQPGLIPVNALVAEESPRAAAAQAAALVALGFTSLKLKVALGSLEQDEALVAAVRGAVGAGTRLRLDANGGWTVQQAVEAIRRLARHGLEYVEQPVGGHDLEGMKTVRAAVPVPVAADESIASAKDAARVLAAGAADILVVKAGRLGGLDMAIEVLRLAAEANTPAVVTSSLEAGVGLAAAAHLAATLPSGPFAHGLATGTLLESDLLTSPIKPTAGMLSVPSGAGLGVEVDQEALRRYAVDVSGSLGAWPAPRQRG